MEILDPVTGEEIDTIRRVLRPHRSYTTALADEMPLRLVLSAGVDTFWETVNISDAEYDALNLLCLLWTPRSDNMGLCYPAVSENIRSNPRKNLGYRYRASIPIARLLVRLRSEA